MLSIIVYRDHASDMARPRWLNNKGTRFVTRKWLRRCGLRSDWNEYLSVMLSMEDVDPKKVLHEKVGRGQRGQKKE